MPTRKITFQGHDGHPLAARLDLPDGPVLGHALFAHCFTCGKDIAAARRIAQTLAMKDFAVLRFDFTGLGHSGGEFANTTFSSNVEDLRRAADWMRENGMAPDLLIGHSLGGAAMLRAAPDIAKARAVVTIGAPFDPDHVTQKFSASVAEIRRNGHAAVRLGDRSVDIGRAFLDDIAATRLEPAIHALKKALLILHAPRDRIVGIGNATEIFRAALHPKSFVSLNDADHLLTRAEDAEYAAHVISAWATRYIDLTPPAPPPGAPEGVTRVSEADPGGFLQDIAIGDRHQLQADEPEAYGGTNLGPSPYGLLAAGLGACTSMTIRMYARRKGWPLEHVSVDVTHDKVHAQDAAPGAEGRADLFTRVIRLEGTLSGDQRDRLRDIADRCPVHRTLEQSSRIETRLA
ncbi:osmotically inducible protein C [Primorskyibacter flagellatus]|uniref:Osmotically inducible protein C n=1 Tax=Primorskyibacter flagellatus TaxID=1387277 RepID=A0A917A2X0_9RHOB|nr:bifunctional alpha/beta hydrolase/OsmC family protein [Primorskyibacter flagellatus]GGE23194.1 osmotically inducible protein C [Primorskyibacter flagellatus]